MRRLQGLASFALALLAVAPAPAASGRQKTRWILHWNYLRNCPNRNAAAEIRNYSVVTDERGEEALSVDVQSTRSAKRLGKLLLDITRCREAVSFNTCERETTWAWDTGVCELARARNMLWSALLDSIAPEPRCPFRKGEYRLRNFTADMDYLVRLGIPFRGIVWLVEGRLYGQRGDLLLCYQSACEGKEIKHRQ